MRIEGISEGSASLAGHAFEQYAPVRASSQRAVRPAPVTPTDHGPTDVVVDVIDVHDSAAASATRTEVEFKVPHRVVAIGSEQRGVIDRNGDGIIDLSDLPFDYFQILHQSNRKSITLPSADLPL